MIIAYVLFCISCLCLLLLVSHQLINGVTDNKKNSLYVWLLLLALSAQYIWG